MKRWAMWWVLTALLTIALAAAIGCEGDDDDDDDQDATGDDDAAGDDDAGDDDDQPEPFYPPDARGPYEVGVMTTCYTDESRHELWGNMDRFLPLEIWYPSTGAGGTLNTLGDMIGPLPEWAVPVMELLYGSERFETLRHYETSAIRNGEVLVREQPWPVLFFSHGLNAVRFQNFEMCELLASHGFIVVAPDHYGDAIFTNNPDGSALVLANPTTIVGSYLDRVEDVEFLHGKLVELNTDAQSPLFGLFDLEHLGLFGHSYGGMTSLLAGPDFEFIDAIAPLNPAYVGVFPTDFAKPFFLLQGDKDNIVGIFNPQILQLWQEADSPMKILLDMPMGGHYSATNACLLLPEDLIPDSTTGCGGDEFITSELANTITNAYLIAFFKATIAEDSRYVPYMRDNHFPADVTVTTYWP